MAELAKLADIQPMVYPEEGGHPSTAPHGAGQGKFVVIDEVLTTVLCHSV